MEIYLDKKIIALTLKIKEKIIQDENIYQNPIIASGGYKRRKIDDVLRYNFVKKCNKLY
jgi:hypothetical protein